MQQCAYWRQGLAPLGIVQGVLCLLLFCFGFGLDSQRAACYIPLHNTWTDVCNISTAGDLHDLSQCYAISLTYVRLVCIGRINVMPAFMDGLAIEHCYQIMFM